MKLEHYRSLIPTRDTTFTKDKNTSGASAALDAQQSNKGARRSERKFASTLFKIGLRLNAEFCKPNSMWLSRKKSPAVFRFECMWRVFLFFFLKGVQVEDLVSVFRHGEVGHLLGGFLRHDLWLFLWAGDRRVRRAVGIFSVAKYNTAHSHVGGAHFDLQHTGPFTCKEQTDLS